MSKPAVSVSHWGGNQNVRALLAALRRADALAAYVTGFAVPEEPPRWVARSPDRLRRAVLRRQYALPSTHIIQRRRTEVLRRFVTIDRALSDLDRFAAARIESLPPERRPRVVYGYEDCTLETFRAAKERGIPRVYDLPIAYWAVGRGLMKEEAQRRPDWIPALGGGLEDSEEKLARKDAELDLADLVVVPSQFVLDSLPHRGRGTARIMVPFGSPPGQTGPRPLRGNALRVLFAGSMTQRKGLADLLDAMQLVSTEDIELVVMGSPVLDLSFYRAFGNFTYEPGRPHHEVLELMRTCDVLCLPSLFEGRALVMQEAMSQGLALLITPNTGGQDLVIEGETGFVVPIRSPEAIGEKLAWFAQHRPETAAMGVRAMDHASTYSWETYGDLVVEAVLGLV